MASLGKRKRGGGGKGGSRGSGVGRREEQYCAEPSNYREEKTQGCVTKVWEGGRTKEREEHTEVGGVISRSGGGQGLEKGKRGREGGRGKGGGGGSSRGWTGVIRVCKNGGQGGAEKKGGGKKNGERV